MTLITTQFSFSSTATEVAAGIDLGGRRALVTGGASGTGAETARVLAAAGAEVTIAAYAQSKTANVLFTVEASRRWAPDGITANALNPGAVPTRLQRHTGGQLLSPPELHKTVAQGAATSVLLATAPAVAGVGGRYFSDGQEAVVVDRRPENMAQLTGAVARYALDTDNAQRLWELSEAAL
jgi:NAD(P)-dependent dehydrogenase (short-subunit alcohol dehydrogenase family)